MANRFYTTEKLGPKQSLTPEGFLLCEEVPIARTGLLVYGPDETPIEAGPNGVVKIIREESEVFHPDAIASFMGKPVTNDHPYEDVTPDNWKELAVGTCMNPRRGVGAMDDLLIADLLITSKSAILLIKEGKREVSCGYEADYEEVAPGAGKQTDIRGNHIALVESGRCGARCAISDHSTINKEATMAKKQSWIDRLKSAIKTKDDAEVENLLKEAHAEAKDDESIMGGTEEGGDTHIHIHSGNEPATSNPAMDDETTGRAKFTDDDIQEHMDQNAAEHAAFTSRLDAIEAALKGGAEDDDMTEEGMMDEMPEAANKEDVMKAKDSRYLKDSYRMAVSQAEVLVPGIRVPVFDQAAKPGQSYKKICGLRRQAIDLAYSQPDTRGMIDDLLTGKTLDTKGMSCDAIRSLFNAAAAMKRNANNAGGGRQVASVASGKSSIKSIADLNKANKEHWKNS
jgi:uncharacterized protein